MPRIPNQPKVAFWTFVPPPGTAFVLSQPIGAVRLEFPRTRTHEMIRWLRKSLEMLELDASLSEEPDTETTHRKPSTIPAAPAIETEGEEMASGTIALGARTEDFAAIAQRLIDEQKTREEQIPPEKAICAGVTQQISKAPLDPIALIAAQRYGITPGESIPPFNTPPEELMRRVHLPEFDQKTEEFDSEPTIQTLPVNPLDQ